MNLAGKRVLVTGGAGFLGQVLCAKLRERGVTDITVPRSREYDLTTEAACRRLGFDYELLKSSDALGPTLSHFLAKRASLLAKL